MDAEPEGNVQSWYGAFDGSDVTSLHRHDAFQMPGALQDSYISGHHSSVLVRLCLLVYAGVALSSKAERNKVLVALIFIVSAIVPAVTARQRRRALCEQWRATRPTRGGCRGGALFRGAQAGVVRLG